MSMSLAHTYGMAHGAVNTLTNMDEMFFKGNVKSLERFLESDEVRNSTILPKPGTDSRIVHRKKPYNELGFLPPICFIIQESV
jgi:hypothetical protein